MTLQRTLLFFAAASLCAADSYLFTSFRGNGETGVYFAISDDGYQWEPLKDNQPWLPPGHKGMLMRDPCIAAGPDGTYHMVWTTGWDKFDGRLTIGYASSRDLVNWSHQKLIPVLPNEPNALNAWAPELLWDKERREWIVFWATTIPARFPDPNKESDRPDRNHRMYAMTTPDFKTFSPSRLFFDPGYSVIDATVLPNEANYVMVFKDERVNPAKKNLRIATADHASGPYTQITEPFTRSWVEGPSVIKIGTEFFVYFDSYRKPQHYGALKSRDLKTWEDVTPKVSFPPDHRHGSVLRIPAATAATLRKVRP